MGQFLRPLGSGDLSGYLVTPTGGTQVSLADAIATLTPGLGTDVTFDDIVTTTLVGTSATVTTATAVTVNATTGTVQGAWQADRHSFADGTYFRTGRPLIPGFTYVDVDPSGNVSGGLMTDGALSYQVILAGDIVSDTATLGTTTATSVDAVTGTIGGFEFNPVSLVPGWSLPFSDNAGNIAGGVRPDGSLEFEHIVAGTVDVTLLNAPGLGAVEASIVTSDARVADNALYIKDSAGNIPEFRRADGSLDTVLAPGVVARHARQIAVPTNRHSYTPPTTGPDTAVAAGTTIHTTWTTRLPFDYVRLVYGRQSVGASVISATVATSAAFNDGVNPLNEAGSAQAWQPVTWNAGGGFAHEPWTQPSGGGATSIVPNGSSVTGIWGFTASDWIQASSLERTDGQLYPMLMVRTYMTGSPVAALVSGTGWMGITPQAGANGHEWACYTASGDYVSSTTGYPSSGGSFATTWAPLFIETYSRELGFQVWGCGDSNMAGVGSNLFGLTGFLRRGVTQVSNRYPVILANFNQSGSSPAIYMGNLATIVDVVKPSALVIFPFSFNVPATETSLNLYWAQAMALCRRVSNHGGVPILVAYPPRDGVTADEDAIRLRGIARLDKAGLSGMRTVNANALIATGSGPQTWAPGKSADLVHFGDPAHCDLGDLLALQLYDAFGV